MRPRATALLVLGLLFACKPDHRRPAEVSFKGLCTPPGRIVRPGDPLVVVEWQTPPRNFTWWTGDWKANDGDVLHIACRDPSGVLDLTLQTDRKVRSLTGFADYTLAPRGEIIVIEPHRFEHIRVLTNSADSDDRATECMATAGGKAFCRPAITDPKSWRRGL